MTKEEIITYVHNLDWNCSSEMQANAIKALSQVDEQYINLIFDKFAKSTWENAVKVIKAIGFPKNKILLPELIWLLQDASWPGVKEAIEILSSIKKIVVIPLIEDALRTADATNDYMWIGGINLLIKEAGYIDSDFTNSDVIQILGKADY